MPNTNHGNGESKPLTDKQLRELAELILQNDERINQLFDFVTELKLDAIACGRPVKDAQKWQANARERATISELARINRWRMRKSLGLD